MTNQNGQKFGFIYNGQYYYYMYNIQGDVIGIWDNNGNIVARYNYNAWGKPISVTDGNGNDVSSNPSHIANINPIRYRGYYYDQETGFYYLQSRYYDPEIGRFINADGQLNMSSGINGCNMFAYCMNNPVTMLDSDGAEPVTIFICAVIGIGLLVDLVSGNSARRAEAVLESPSLYNVSNWASSGFVETVKGAVAPEKPLSLQHWVDSTATAAAIVSPMSKIPVSGSNKISVPKISAPKNTGVPFKTGQRVGTVQIGVDPKTLKLNTAIHPIKYQAAKAKINSSGMYGVIEVYSNGTVYNGNHRTLIGSELGIPVDTIVVFK